MIPVSILILTLNEEANIRSCLESCAWCDDVAVLDSGSTDKTIPIAREMGAKVYEHPFISFGAQRNWAIDNIPMKHDWVFHLDADEQFTPELVDEIEKLIATSPAESGFYVPSKLMFMGRWLKRSGGYPVYQMRLFHKRRMRFCDYGHGQREQTTGTIGRLGNPYLHYNFSKGIDDWIEKHNRYSSTEARQIIASRMEPLRIRELLSTNVVERRRTMKRLWYRLPFRAQLRFMVTFCIKLGVLEGRAGRTFASLLALYERMTDLKVQLERMKSAADIGSASQSAQQSD